MVRNFDPELSFKECQHKIRGLAASFRSHRFQKSRTVTPASQFRKGLRRVYLESRVALHGLQFADFLSWSSRFIKAQLPELATIPVGFSSLAGIEAKPPIADLETELHWIAARINEEAPRLSLFRELVASVEGLVYTGAYAEALIGLDAISKTFGASLWSVQLKIAVEHQAGGLEAQKRYMAEVRRIHGRGLLAFIAYHTSVLNEDRTTLSKHEEEIGLRIQRHPHYIPAVKTYMRYRMLGEWPSSHTAIADVLRTEQSHSIIDIYETFVLLLQESVRRPGDSELNTLVRSILKNGVSVSDFRLQKLQPPDDREASSQLPERRREVSDLLFAEQVGKSARALRAAVSNSPIDIWNLIYGGLTLASHKVRFPTTIRNPIDICKMFATIVGRQHTGFDPIAFLRKYANNRRGLPLYTALLDTLNLMERRRPDDPWRPWLIGLNSPTSGIEDSPIGGELRERWCNANAIAASRTLADWNCLHREGAIPSGASAHIFRAARAIAYGEFDVAIPVLAALREQSPHLPPLRAVASAMLLHCYFGLGRRQDVIAIVADEGALGEMHRKMLPIGAALDGYTWSDYKCATPLIAAPLALQMLWSVDEKAATLSLLRFATGTFLRTPIVFRPSEMIEMEGLYRRHQLVFFLREVCVPQILDTTRILKSSRDVQEERQAICAALRELDKPNTAMYEGEVVGIANQAALEDGQWIVDRTRIHVDAAAFARWAEKTIAEDYARYRDLLGVELAPDQNFDDVIRELLTAGSAQNQKLAVKPEGEADALLFAILHRLVDEFLNNPQFGLDFYLSKRIRHQSFVGLIRGPLEFSQLITTRESESGRYHKNEFWVGRFKECTDSTKELIAQAFERCAMNFDELLTSAKDNYFHVRSPEKGSGLLLLEVSLPVFNLAKVVAQMDYELSEFMTTAVALFWGALEPSLLRTRAFIADNLKTRIAEIFDQLKASVKTLAGADPAVLDFDIEMGRQSTEVQRALDDATRWFAHADIEAQKRHFRLEQVLDIAVDSALKCQRGFHPILSKVVCGGELQMDATTLVFVHDVLIVALDNARLYSGLQTPKVTVSAIANAELGTLTVIVANECRPTVRAQKEAEVMEIRSVIDSGGGGRRTRAEGKSGFLKLAAVANQSAKGSIEFGFLENGVFELKVIYSLIISTAEAASAPVV